MARVYPSIPRSGENEAICDWLRLMDGERRWSGREFQTTGAVMKKLRLPSLVVLVCGTNRSPCSAERRPGRTELSATEQAMLLKCLGHRLTTNCLKHWKKGNASDDHRHRCLNHIKLHNGNINGTNSLQLKLRNIQGQEHVTRTHFMSEI